MIMPSPSHSCSTIALIVAAGQGERAGGGMPKQYRMLCGETVLRRVVRVFLENPAISAVQIVIGDSQEGHYEMALADLDGRDGLLTPVIGGTTRQMSVRAGLESLAEREPPPDYVLIHDGARPFVSYEEISAVLDALKTKSAAVPVLPSTDALKYRDEKTGQVLDIQRSIKKESTLWRTLTPQGFHFADIIEAHRKTQQEYDDDIALAQAAGFECQFVEGRNENIKLTTHADFEQAEQTLKRQSVPLPRTGFGYDVHRFGKGNHVILCGVTIPFENGLEGHSDADAGFHAVTDAILGALGGGDIGDHFPPHDGRWKDAASFVFLNHAASLVSNDGGVINHVDVTLICEKPHLMPYKQSMKESTAHALGIKPRQVSIKATTTEGLGFIGKGQGIAAYAIATLLFYGKE
ncbi:MAG: 2-C-methyl-D-erythritol 2,4-cyclodiphosphate synthase [Parvularculales bacterium]